MFWKTVSGNHLSSCTLSNPVLPNPDLSFPILLRKWSLLLITKETGFWDRKRALCAREGKELIRIQLLKKSGNFVAPKSTSSSEISSLEAWSKMTHFIYLFILLFHILSIVSPRSSPLSPLTLLSASPISFFKQETKEEYLFTYSFNQLEGPIM